MLAQSQDGRAARTDAGLPRILQAARGLLDLIPVGLCVCDADGVILYHNHAAADLWGRSVALGSQEERFCGSHLLFTNGGKLLPHDEWPVAVALLERRALRSMELIAERPDGSRVALLAYPTPVYDDHGALLGAINVLVDVANRLAAERAAINLAAIVDSTDLAIFALDRNGIITDWNRGAERFYGYSGAEAIGQSVDILVPPDRKHEAAGIFDRSLRGEGVNGYETVRRRKDGTTIDVSLTETPILDAAGMVVGVSRIAHDITERKRAAERRDLLIAEMNHRVKNLLVMAGSLVSLSARSARSVQELASDLVSRLTALARAHELSLPRKEKNAAIPICAISLHALIETIAAPFQAEAADGTLRVSVEGPDVTLALGAPMTGMALLLHEFTINAAKYGALANPDGTVSIRCSEVDGHFVVTWTERGGRPVAAPDRQQSGFGSKLIDLTVRRQLGGEIVWEWLPEGLVLRISVARDRLMQ